MTTLINNLRDASLAEGRRLADLDRAIAELVRLAENGGWDE